MGRLARLTRTRPAVQGSPNATIPAGLFFEGAGVSETAPLTSVAPGRTSGYLQEAMESYLLRIANATGENPDEYVFEAVSRAAAKDRAQLTHADEIRECPRAELFEVRLRSICEWNHLDA